MKDVTDVVGVVNEFGQEVLIGEKCDRGTIINDGVGEVKLTVKADKDGNSRFVRWVFDCGELSGEQLMVYALRSMVIDVQRMYRKAEKKAEFYDRTFVLPDDLIVKRAASGGSKDKLIKLLKGMSAAEREELLGVVNESGTSGEVAEVCDEHETV